MSACEKHVCVFKSLRAPPSVRCAHYPPNAAMCPMALQPGQRVAGPNCAVADRQDGATDQRRHISSSVHFTGAGFLFQILFKRREKSSYFLRNGAGQPAWRTAWSKRRLKSPQCALTSGARADQWGRNSSTSTRAGQGRRLGGFAGARFARALGFA